MRHANLGVSIFRNDETRPWCVFYYCRTYYKAVWEGEDSGEFSGGRARNSHVQEIPRDSFVPEMKKRIHRAEDSSARGQESTQHGLQLGVL